MRIEDRLGPLLCELVIPALFTAALRPLRLTSVASSALAYVRGERIKSITSVRRLAIDGVKIQ